MSSSHDVVVIGGSAGAIEALRQILRSLPAELPARLFVTVHFPANVTSALPRVLARAGPLPARHPADGESTTPSMLYVAPPDHHLVVKRGAVRVVRGPRENGHRPAVDPLFRSAAAVYGPRVLAIVLSGNLDDGSAGARAVAGAGGTVLVQDPADALYPGMPSNALTSVPDALVLPLHAMAERIVALAGTRGGEEMIDHEPRAYDQHASVIRNVLREAPFVHGGAGSDSAGVGETDA